MVETITPVVHGGRNRSYSAAVALHVLSATLAAALVGALLGAAGRLLEAPWGVAGIVAAIAVSALYAARELLGIDIPLPGRKAQVPDWWRSFYSPPTTAIMYGAGLGAGFLTYPTYGTFTAVAVLATVSGDPLAGALLCAPFGLARGLSVLASLSGADSGMVVEHLNDIAARRAPALVNGGVMVAVAVACTLALS
jgi:hypothetical protein